MLSGGCRRSCLPLQFVRFFRLTTHRAAGTRVGRVSNVLMILRGEINAILHSEEIIHASESELPVARFRPLPYPETVVQI